MKRYIRSDNIFGMARVGYSGGLEVYVNTNDSGNIPHFHLRREGEWGKFHTCIKIESPEYFWHEGKRGVLNSGQRKALVEFMKSPVGINKYANRFENNWELICFMWDINNSDMQISNDATMPDYTLLPTVNSQNIKNK